MSGIMAVFFFFFTPSELLLQAFVPLGFLFGSFDSLLFYFPNHACLLIETRKFSFTSSAISNLFVSTCFVPEICNSNVVNTSQKSKQIFFGLLRHNLGILGTGENVVRQFELTQCTSSRLIMYVRYVTQQEFEIENSIY